MYIQKLDRSGLELLVLAAYAHDEISIGRAREILHWTDRKIKEEAEKRVSNGMKLKEERERLESEVEHLNRKLEPPEPQYGGVSDVWTEEGLWWALSYRFQAT